jgi:hypothetical protein
MYGPARVQGRVNGCGRDVDGSGKVVVSGGEHGCERTRADKRPNRQPTNRPSPPGRPLSALKQRLVSSTMTAPPTCGRAFSTES